MMLLSGKEIFQVTVDWGGGIFQVNVDAMSIYTVTCPTNNGTLLSFV